MQLVTDSDGVPLSSDFYKMSIPPFLMSIMLDYVESSGLKKLFEYCIDNSPRSFKTDVTQCPMRWDVRRRPQPSACDMYWISPSNLESHVDMLSRLGSGGFDTLLKAIASVLQDDIPHLTVYQLTYVLVSYCNEQRFHTDNDDSLTGDVWTVIFPLILVPNSSPELAVRHSVLKTEHLIKYNVGEALIWGPLTEHSTAQVKYDAGFRVCVAINVGFINPLNVRQIVLDITQKYPPRSGKLLLEWAKNPHWRKEALHDDTYFPRVPDAILLGSEWFSKYTELVSLKEGGSIVEEDGYPSSLRQWMAHQRYCFALKHGLRDQERKWSSSIASASRTLTCYREAKLRQIGFLFTVQRDEGANQLKWLKMYQELHQFVISHGHFKVSIVVNEKLHSWIRTQKRTLADSSKLTMIKKKRKQMLLDLGMQI